MDVYKQCKRRHDRTIGNNYGKGVGIDSPQPISRILFQGLLVSAPAMEAFCKSLRLLVLEGKEEFARSIRLLDPHVLNVHLKRIKLHFIAIYR